ncbi:MAG: hypothetical protein EP330_07090 [Deltaproteobacteria bacterium]|nr:MAG: hypothetical protein EP330_07090 [Deltaproteobacteria bacterium]
MTRFVLVALALVACANPQSAELEEQAEVWAAAGIDDYVWDVQRSCFCEFWEPVRVEVVGGEIASATRQVTDGDPVVLESGDYEDWMTVDGLFDEARRAVDEADEVTLAFASEGYPTLVDIDWMKNAIDDEVSYSAEGLAPILE